VTRNSTKDAELQTPWSHNRLARISEQRLNARPEGSGTETLEMSAESRWSSKQSMSFGLRTQTMIGAITMRLHDESGDLSGLGLIGLCRQLPDALSRCSIRYFTLNSSDAGIIQVAHHVRASDNRVSVIGVGVGGVTFLVLQHPAEASSQSKNRDSQCHRRSHQRLGTLSLG